MLNHDLGAGYRPGNCAEHPRGRIGWHGLPRSCSELHKAWHPVLERFIHRSVAQYRRTCRELCWSASKRYTSACEKDVRADSCSQGHRQNASGGRHAERTRASVVSGRNTSAFRTADGHFSLRVVHRGPTTHTPGPSRRRRSFECSCARALIAFVQRWLTSERSFQEGIKRAMWRVRRVCLRCVFAAFNATFLCLQSTVLAHCSTELDCHMCVPHAAERQALVCLIFRIRH